MSEIDPWNGIWPPGPGEPGMSIRMRQVAAVMALVGVLFATGSQWVVLQSVAWANMWVRYAQQEGGAAAWEKTFDGRHPCPLCRKVQEGRRADRERSPLERVERRPDCLLTLDPVHVPGYPLVRERTPYVDPFYLDEGALPTEPIPRGEPGGFSFLV